ncbi:unnamed protein product [Prorocentrum cordatum]|uniref:Uncharacterized protein n=1 Tax=Prorocentrum cordatum TaxID=2364126 RepID=A0ABN9QTF9_9DINO|nr:unnamed protein product [Polarella glacialis]
MAGTACAGAQLPGSALASRPRDRSAPRTAFGRPPWLEHACGRPLHSHGDATPGLARDLGPGRVRRPPALRSLGPAPVTLSELQERRRGGWLVGVSFTSSELPQMERDISKESGAAEVFLDPPNPYGFARTCFGARLGPRVGFSPLSRKR